MSKLHLPSLDKAFDEKSYPFVPNPHDFIMNTTGLGWKLYNNYEEVHFNVHSYSHNYQTYLMEFDILHMSIFLYKTYIIN